MDAHSPSPPRNLFAKLLLLAAFALFCLLVWPVVFAFQQPTLSFGNQAEADEPSAHSGTTSSTPGSRYDRDDRRSYPPAANRGQTTYPQLDASHSAASSWSANMKGHSRGRAQIQLAATSPALQQPQVSAETAPASYRLSDQNLEAQPETAPNRNLTGGSIRAGGTMAEELPLPQKMLALVEFNEVPLSEAMRLFSEQAGLNVITSTEAGKTKVNVFLKNVSAQNALEAIVKANGLFYRIEPNSGIVRLSTLNEYEKDLASFREERTRVFTLLYPNPSSVAQVIQQVFGNRVQLNRADGEIEDLTELTQRFTRFDLLDGRSLGLGGSGNRGGNQGGGMGVGMGGMGMGGMGMGGMGMDGMGMGGMGMGGNAAGMLNNQSQIDGRKLNPSEHPSNLRDLSSDEIQKIENQFASIGSIDAQTRADLMQRQEATIYVSTIRRNNQVIVRTGDEESMQQIAALITQLDVPTPTVLLEVKVLRIALADGFNSAFELLGTAGRVSTAFSDGSLAPPFPGGSGSAQRLADGLGVAGAVPGALTFQVVDKNFRARMQLLESQNCVTALATPLILTANNEVSRIFVGDTIPFTVGFTPSQVLSSVGAVNGAVAATPITELRDVGQSLLITPNINADRTVTLRIVEENSERVVGGSSIPVPATSGSGVTNINVDTVRRRTISGTVVAQDGMAVALGGMIEEHSSNARDQVPVLGKIPGLGFFFRRQAISNSRSELVVIVRPYVFNTPSESAATSEILLGELSSHPSSPNIASGKSHTLPFKVTRDDASIKQRAQLFKINTASPVIR